MEIHVDEPIRRDPALNQAVERAGRWLEEILGDSKSLVKDRWDLRFDDSQRPVAELTLTDPYGGPVSVRFAPQELSSEPHAKANLYKLWGDLLQIQSKRALDRLHESIQRL